jgi:serine/threonine protein kinase
MDPKRWEQAERLFHEILERPQDQREGYLDSACGADSELKAEVRDLLDAYEASAQELPPVPAAPLPETSGTARRIGHYILEKEIGEGGMGSVYLASRADEHFEKKVAIKLIRPGPGAKALIQRFYTERQILAGLEHPNITRLLDGGMTNDGQPYLVMDYVDGIRLDSYCDGLKLTIGQRLELFQKVCSAVGYAHRSLVIHRDLKPGNILVTEDGEPKLLDFGIAKVVRANRPLEGQTATVGLFFTPLYACPEILQGLNTTVSSDIYSLGVVLYELLAGRVPWDEYAVSPVELMMAITSKDPPKPSVAARRESQAEESAEEVASRRGETPERLARILSGDLDAIALKALAKNAADRYASAEEFSADIGRYLDGRPVHAQRRTQIYVVRKFVRRHWRGLAASGVAICLLSATGAYAWRQQMQAGQRFEETRAIANYLLFDLFDQVSRLRGATSVRVRMAQRAQMELDRLATLSAGNDAVLLEAAAGYNRLAEAYGAPRQANLGDPVSALASLGRAKAILDRLHKAQPANAAVQLERAKNLLTEAEIEIWSNQQTAPAKPLIDAAEQALMGSPHPQNPAWESARALLRQEQGELAGFNENWADVERYSRTGLEELETWSPVMKQESGYASAKARLLRFAGDGRYYKQQVLESLGYYQRAEAILRDANSKWPNHPAVLSGLMAASYDVATTFEKLGRKEDCFQAMNRAVDAGRSILEINDRDDRLQFAFQTTRQLRAELLAEAGRFEEAVKQQEEVVREREARAAAQPGVNLPSRYLAFSVSVLGDVLDKGHDRKRACGAWRQALTRFEALDKNGGLTSWDKSEIVAKTRNRIAGCP